MANSLSRGAVYVAQCDAAYQYVCAVGEIAFAMSFRSHVY